MNHFYSVHNGKRSRVPFKRGEIFSKMGSEKFCLSWADFESSISVAFRELREEKDFFDVTLICNEDQIKAHKVLHLAFIPLSNTASPKCLDC